MIIFGFLNTSDHGIEDAFLNSEVDSLYHKLTQNMHSHIGTKWHEQIIYHTGIDIVRATDVKGQLNFSTLMHFLSFLGVICWLNSLGLML